MKRSFVHRRYYDMRAGMSTLWPFMSLINFILIAYNFTNINSVLPIWAFVVILLVVLAGALSIFGMLFRTKQLSTDKQMEYEQNFNQVKNERLILEGLLHSIPDSKLKLDIIERVSYLKIIEGNHGIK